MYIYIYIDTFQHYILLGCVLTVWCAAMRCNVYDVMWCGLLCRYKTRSSENLTSPTRSKDTLISDFRLNICTFQHCICWVHSYHVMWCGVVWCDMMWCDILWCCDKTRFCENLLSPTLRLDIWFLDSLSSIRQQRPVKYASLLNKGVSPSELWFSNNAGLDDIAARR